MVGEKNKQKRDKLKDIQFTLKDKHNRNETMITFLEKMMNVQLVNNKLTKSLKLEVFKLEKEIILNCQRGLNKLSEEMNKVNTKLSEFKKLAKQLQSNEVEIGKYRSKIQELSSSMQN